MGNGYLHTSYNRAHRNHCNGSNYSIPSVLSQPNFVVSPITKKELEDLWQDVNSQNRAENDFLETWMVRNFGHRCEGKPNCHCRRCSKWILFDKLKVEEI